MSLENVSNVTIQLNPESVFYTMKLYIFIHIYGPMILNIL